MLLGPFPYKILAYVGDEWELEGDCLHEDEAFRLARLLKVVYNQATVVVTLPTGEKRMAMPDGTLKTTTPAP